jgi:FtsP/CotA-like multicopper oxidase with cupredoxin domain
LRVINGSNARTFRLVLLRDGQPNLDRITQIGTDGGLLRAPVEVPSGGLVLAPAERADLLVDFSDLAPGSELTVLNTAPADGDEDGALVTVTDGDETTRYHVVAAHFEDTTTFFPVLDEYEVWQLINLTGDTHPIHLHLDPFQILARRPIRYEIPAGGIGDRDLAATIKLERDPDDELNHAIDDNERGLKDTVRVNPNELVEIAVRFTTYSGRYMYHCHILEHEDRDMMRPFVTMPAALMSFMA